MWVSIRVLAKLVSMSVQGRSDAMLSWEKWDETLLAVVELEFWTLLLMSDVWRWAMIQVSGTLGVLGW